MTTNFLNLKTRVRLHDWESVERIDLMERLELVRELKDMKMEELAEMFKLVGPRTTVLILELIKGVKNG